MQKELSSEQTRKLVRLAAAISDDHIKTKDQLYDQLAQLEEEIDEIAPDCCFEDRITIYKTTLQTAERFDKDAHLKDLFR